MLELRYWYITSFVDAFALAKMMKLNINVYLAIVIMCSSLNPDGTDSSWYENSVCQLGKLTLVNH